MLEKKMIKNSELFEVLLPLNKISAHHFAIIKPLHCSIYSGCMK